MPSLIDTHQRSSLLRDGVLKRQETYLQERTRRNVVDKCGSHTVGVRVICTPSVLQTIWKFFSGKKFFPVTITEEMIGHKLGEFSATRQFFGHTPADKKAAPATEKKDEKK